MQRMHIHNATRNPKPNRLFQNKCLCSCPKQLQTCLIATTVCVTLCTRSRTLNGICQTHTHTHTTVQYCPRFELA